MVADRFRFGLVLWMLFPPIALAVTAVPRLLTVDDVLGAQAPAQPFEYETAMAADGRGAAFAITRAPASDPVGWSDNPLTHYDIFVQRAPREAVAKITDGETDSSGWFEPQWSPDGRRLLLKSTRGGAVHLWLWEPGTARPRQLSSEPVDVMGRFDTVWLDGSRILFSSQAKDERLAEFFPVSQRRAVAGWSRASNGVESSAVALSSARTGPIPEPGGRLLLLDSSSGEVATVANGDIEHFSLSPDNHYVAVSLSGGSRLEVRAVSGELFFEDERAGAHFSLGSWDSSSRGLVYWVVDSSGKQLYRVAPPSGTANRIDLNGLQPNVARLPEWTADGRLLVEATSANAHGRSDWYLVDGQARIRNLTSELAPLAAPLYGSTDRKSFLTLAGGKLLRITPDTATPLNLPRPGAGRVDSLSPAYQERNLASANLLITANNDWYVVDRTSFHISKPAVHGSLATWSTPAKQSLSYVADRNGTFIYRNRELLLTLNAGSRNIAAGEVRPFEYRGPAGESLRGCVLLPINYRAKVHYPLLTYIYAGAIQDGSCDEMRAMATLGAEKPFLNMQLAASRGFAVLMPSMPLRSGAGPRDVLEALPIGVLPAVDKLIELGIADANRLFVMGHSFGGYSTYGLITQTQRFKAAVAISGYADLVSYYGTASGRYRYSATPDVMFFGMVEERFNTALGAPPWQDRDRYVRNSPITYSERVATPLLLIHGDQDFVPITQAEEFFAALFRQGKPAQLVKYLGEGHLISSPANVRDLWSRVFAWLDEYGDIARDTYGNLLFSGEQVQSRGGAPALQPQDFARFDRPAASGR